MSAKFPRGGGYDHLADSLEAELNKRQLSLLHSVVVSENECLKSLAQRRLHEACSFNNQNSFFFKVKNFLDTYDLPTLTQLVCSNLSKLKWKRTYIRTINNFWTKSFVREIKMNKKTLKYLATQNCNDTSVTDVRKGVFKARILTGTYILQKNRQSFSKGTVDAVCRHCQLEDEDLLFSKRCFSRRRIIHSTTTAQWRSG